MSAGPSARAEAPRIPERFVGPPGYGNGGYSCGAFATLVDGPAQVTLRRPVPLEQSLTPVRGEDGSITVEDEQGPIAEVEAIVGLGSLEPPARPSLGQAELAARDSPFLGPTHPFPGCFVCGHEHPHGLEIHAGALAGDPFVGAAPFRPDPTLPARDGALAPEIVWAALDCPSFTPARVEAGVPHLLGRMSAELLAPVPCDESAVMVGWELESQGRKLHSASALLTAEGDLLARSRALWISVGSAQERARKPS